MSPGGFGQYTRIQVHLGKTQVWNRGGRVPPACVEMQAAADRADPQSQARIWRGAGARDSCTGHPDWPRGVCAGSTPGQKHSILLDRIPLEVLGCSSFSAQTHVPRIPFTHDVATWRCFTRLLGISGVGETQDWASLPFQMGGNVEFGSQPTGRQSQDDQLTSPRSCCHYGQVPRIPDISAPLHRVGLFFGSRVSTLLSGKHFSLFSLALCLPSSIPEQGWQHVASLVVEERFVNTVVVPRASPGYAPLARRSSLWASRSPRCPCRRSCGSTLTCSGCSCCAVGHGRLWPNRLWPNRLCDRVWPNRLCPELVFQWYGRLWPKPTLAKPTLAQTSF